MPCLNIQSVMSADTFKMKIKAVWRKLIVNHMKIIYYFICIRIACKQLSFRSEPEIEWASHFLCADLCH